MIEKIGVVRNPLTVVAIFAGIAEVSGSVVLPFVATENQRLYINFLIWFPVYLVSLFFLVLLLKHKVLYAPSDFKDDKSFVDLLKPGSETERIKKIDEEIKEGLKAASQKSQLSEIVTPNEAKKIQEDVADLRLKYLAAEELVISRISRETGLSFTRNSLVAAATGENTFTFDATAEKDKKLFALEIKVIRSPAAVQTVVTRSLEPLAAFINYVPSGRSNIHFTLVIVLDSLAVEKRQIVEAHLQRLIVKFSFISSLRVFTFKELQTPQED